VHEHAFVDESTRRGTTLVACVLPATDVVRVRQSMRDLRLPRQTHLHFTRERSSRRQQIIKVVADSGVRFRAYDAGRDLGPRDARDDCLRRIVADLAARDVRRLVVELDEGSRAGDHKTLYEEVRSNGRVGLLEYHVLPKRQEPLLWLADAVVWCWTHPEWRDCVRNLHY
jgi:hypothetical protein